MSLINIPEIEEKILEFWNKKKIFQKSLDKESPKGDFVFYDGPPFATGTPHYGHIVASLMKDMVPRYWTMQGYHVERRWGWDCHGLPIENIVEEEMKLKSKKDIENVGVDKFNEACRSKVLIYAEEWRKVIERLGRWVDMDNDYKTMDKDFMESIWWVFKQLWNKGLIYEGYKSMHICPRCETTLSQSEVTQGYEDIEDLSVIAKFELIDDSAQGGQAGTFVLAWTTTPWTLIGNVALAVGRGIDYVKVYSNINSNKFKDHSNKGGAYYILAKENLKSIFKDKKFEIVGSVKAKDLENKKYRPLFDYYLGDANNANANAANDANNSLKVANLKNKENLYTIQLADFVAVEDGTGIVHIAPAFGEDDMNLGREKNLPFIQHVKMDGRFTDEVKDFAGMEVKPKNNHQATDKKILDYLEKKGLVFKIEPFVHSYPHCWRCESPLLNYATSSWFVNVTKLMNEMLEHAKKIHWTPEHIKEGRFGKWLEGARDWSISRQRFWGSVMPIWVCDKCGEKKVFGSVNELEKISGSKVEDLHKHFVDKIEFKCEKCSGVMKRISDVLDCWFESGSMPYAQMHYPFENKEKFEKNFPAQFIAEGVDQTRCWFYYLHVLSTALKDSEAYKNVIANGIVLAEDGKKMSKRLQNYPEPMNVFHKYGADAVRHYLATSPVMRAEDLCFCEKDVDEVVKKVILILLNVLSFYRMYVDANSANAGAANDANVGDANDANADAANSANVEDANDANVGDANNANGTANGANNVLDKWIIVKTELLKKEITEGYNQYDLNKATRPLADFINELSTWYLRRSRERLKGDNEKEKISALKTLRGVLLELSKLMAPVMPFLAEHIYKEINGEKESVHLEDWPSYNEKLIDKSLIDKMEATREFASLGLNERAQAGISVRQPLAPVNVTGPSEPFEDLLKAELNVEGVDYTKAADKSVKLDTKLTPELKQKGAKRELVRQINDLRKKAGLTIKDTIVLYYQTESKELEKIIQGLLGDVIASKAVKEKKAGLVEKELDMDGEGIWVGIRK